MWWKKAGQLASGGSHSSFPGRLVLVPDAENDPAAKNTVLTEEGRLSRRRLLEHAAAIDKFFGCEVSRLLSRVYAKRTLVIE